MPTACVSQDEHFARRLSECFDQIDDAREARKVLPVDGEPPSHGVGLYLRSDELTSGMKGWAPRSLDLSGIAPGRAVTGAQYPGRALCALISAEQASGNRVVVTGLAHERRVIERAINRGLQVSPELKSAWSDVEKSAGGSVSSFDMDVDAGFVDNVQALTLIAASEVLGGRLAKGARAQSHLLTADLDLRPGDVVHEDHGIGVLRELETVEIEGVARDTLRLEYHGGASVLAQIEDIGRIWRYGAGEETVSLDRLKGDAWLKRRAEVSRHLDSVARRLMDAAKERAEARCDPISPPAEAYRRFVSRFGYAETPDQAAAIASVLEDLSSGRPMDRLICGDVGFGKTEVALRGAAAVALSGRQVAVCAPTTVLAKQHFHTFQRRFSGVGLKIVHLSRLVSARDAKLARAAIADGEACIAIGTHALAGAKVAFPNLGLMIIDEEQKFGAVVKQRLRELAGGAHLLAMTATPIPRTLLTAMVGLQDVSVIASPPARRRPIRTFLAPFDAASVRTALMREKRRGGQSFVVAPRIEDIGSLAAQLNKLVPELSVSVAHGNLPADEVDHVMVDIADGKGDILLATNIIESGLDVPGANTIIIWRPDRFGLAQLHQLRGRVGRGRVQGIAYLLHDPSEELSEATRARLSTLEAFDRLGSGLAISARDLDLRGAGDLTGNEQAGHMQMVGASLYSRLLNRAIRTVRGDMSEDDAPPIVQVGERGSIPVDHVPDAVTRINLYARLARLTNVQEIDAFEEELIDRFGPVPASLVLLLTRARLSALARTAGVLEVVAGPKGLALVLSEGRRADALRVARKSVRGSELKGDRLIVPLGEEDPAVRLAMAERLLSVLA